MLFLVNILNCRCEGHVTDGVKPSGEATAGSVAVGVVTSGNTGARAKAKGFRGAAYDTQAGK